jgi:diaminopimelate decarboxylase
VKDEIVKKIISLYGTPIYILDKDILGLSANELERAFDPFPFKVNIAYPYKANSTKKICEYMFKRGYWAEISSGFELELALRLGIKPNQIIYNSPYKPDQALIRALTLGCIVNIDSFEEAERISKILSKKKIHNPNLGVRFSINSETNWDKFGFQLGEEGMSSIFKIQKKYGLDIMCLHTHRSNIGNLGEYKKHISEFIEFAANSYKSGLVMLKYLDLGSGFAINYPKPKDLLDWDAPPMLDYSEIIKMSFIGKQLPVDLEIIIEPGRRLISSSTTLYTSIVSIKERPTGRIIIVDAGQNLVPGIDFYEYPIHQLRNIDKTKHSDSYNIHGCLCDSMDIIGRDIKLCAPIVNEILAIECVGGYDISRSFYWQLPKPKIIWGDNVSGFDLIRREEYFDDIWASNI